MRTLARVLATLALATSAIVVAITPAYAQPDPALALPALAPGEIRKSITTADGTFVYGWMPASGSTVQDASPCGGAVCETIKGHGLFVSVWNIHGLTPVPLCSYGTWLMNAVPVLDTDLICGGPGLFYGYWSPNRNFPTGLACATWWNLPGTACALLHS